MEKELLRKLGEETLYSAKGHFKACDLRRQMATYTIWGCAILNVLSLLVNDSAADKWLSAIGLFGLIALLIWNEGEGKHYRTRHKETAEKYLVLHKEIRACFLLDECDIPSVKKLSDRVSTLDSSDKLDIPSAAKWLAKRAIEKGGETDNWFLKLE